MSTSDLSQSNMSQSNIAMIGLGVMGKSLALNLLDQGFNVTGFDISEAHRERAESEAKELAQKVDKGSFFKAADLNQVLDSLVKPRVIALSVPAGSIVEAVIDDLLAAGLEQDDIVIDTGNSLWTDSVQREEQYKSKFS